MKKSIALVAGLSLGLAACGGGGGGDGSSAGVSVNYDGPDAGTAAAIDTQEKADAATKAVVVAMTNMGSADMASYKAGTEQGARFPLQVAVGEVVQSVTASSGSGAVVGVTNSDTRDCPSGGTISATNQSAVSGEVTVGDYTEIVWNHCKMSDSMEFHGVARSTFTSAYGTPSEYASADWGLGMRMDIGISMSTADGMYVAMDGGYTAEVDFVYATSTTATGIYGDSLAMEFSDGTERFAQLLTDFDFSLSESNGLITAEHNFTVANSLIDGSVTVETIEPFVMYASARYPHQGKMVVTGGNGGKVMLTVIDTTVTVRYDLDGDGEYGTTDADDPEDRTVAWSEI